ncbi:uncharacterized protein BJ171DRAFT_480908 [Polychytrium aggregatum]|uniref:uncharacterized protein n=1 Tax=Polychytrium aggregatum TaxID=110093 RepID=UPI0022FF3DE8|nr:uncharacterized protein BJ171DRAFT_480908 [Polychytrium aggregatum]KAI9193054.1 hypothetical protein BJ171DRAFT_480908 [Polychytrium aggregatum]
MSKQPRAIFVARLLCFVAATGYSMALPVAHGLEKRQTSSSDIWPSPITLFWGGFCLITFFILLARSCTGPNQNTSSGLTGSSVTGGDILNESSSIAREFQRTKPPPTNELPTPAQRAQIEQESIIDSYKFVPSASYGGVATDGNLVVRFTTQALTRSCLSKHPLIPPPGQPLCYFEAEIVSPQTLLDSVQVSIGLATNPYPPMRHVGVDKFSVGLTRNGQALIDGVAVGGDLGSYTLNSVVGCGYYPESGQVFFTLNGQLIAQYSCHKRAYHAAVSASSQCRIRVNLGLDEFLYSHSAGLQRTDTEELPSYEVAVSS